MPYLNERQLAFVTYNLRLEFYNAAINANLAIFHHKSN